MSHPQTHIATVAFGSNLGDKIAHCEKAIEHLQRHPKCQLLKVSSFYETEPLNLPNQNNNPWFINGVLQLKTTLNSVKLLHLLRDIEKQMGREEEEHRHKWAPRVIDLDILFFDDEITKSKTLVIPHPELQHRRFVLEPLCEVWPHLLHPVSHKSMLALLAELKDSKKVVPLFNFYLKKAITGEN